MVVAGKVDTSKYSAPMALIVVAFSLAAAAIGGFMLLMNYSFTTMMDPDLPADERSAQMAEAFLFNDGPTQIVLIMVYSLHFFGGLTSAAVHLCAAVTGRPGKTSAIRISIAGAVAFSTMFVAYCLWLRAHGGRILSC